jgi:hypothetical protein
MGSSTGQHGRVQERFFVGTEAQWEVSAPPAVNGFPQVPTTGPAHGAT